MSLQLKRKEDVVSVFNDKKLVAEIRLDYLTQVDEVVLYADSSSEVHLQVLRLAMSHVHQFVRNREVPMVGGLVTVKSPKLTKADSDRLMDFAMIPAAIQSLDRDTIVTGLRYARVDLVSAVYKTANEAVRAAVSKVALDGLTWRVIPRQQLFSYEVMLQFAVPEPYCFTFWHSHSKPTHHEYELYIVPSYHPVMSGWESIGMVNGDTDAYIGGHAVRSLYCPEEARSARDDRNFLSSSWGQVKHPFRATGHSMTIQLNTIKVRAAEGAETLAQLLRAVLALDKTYVSISGGFRAPMKSPHNRLVELGCPSPYQKNRRGETRDLARGSEAHCVWAYRTLKAEGVLDKAYVPSWFLREGWLELYEGALIQPGLY